MSVSSNFHFRDTSIGRDIEKQLDSLEQSDPKGTKYVVIERGKGAPIIHVIDSHIAAQLARAKNLTGSEVWVFSGTNKQEIEHQIDLDKKAASLFPKPEQHQQAVPAADPVAEAERKEWVQDKDEKLADEMCHLFYISHKRFDYNYTNIYKESGYDPQHLDEELPKNLEEFQKVKKELLELDDESKKRICNYLGRVRHFGSPRDTIEDYVKYVDEWFKMAIATAAEEKKILAKIAVLENLPEEKRFQELKKIQEEIYEYNNHHTTGQMGILNEIHDVLKKGEGAVTPSINAAKRALTQLQNHQNK